MNGSRVKLDIDATRDNLGALGLSYAAEALDALLAEAVQAEMPAHVFLNRLLEAERSGREERRVRTMLKSAKIPTGQTLETRTCLPTGDRTVPHRHPGDRGMDPQRGGDPDAGAGRRGQVAPAV